jgi:HSP20 family molecular chaperone IbpA
MTDEPLPPHPSAKLERMGIEVVRSHTMFETEEVWVLAELPGCNKESAVITDLSGCRKESIAVFLHGNVIQSKEKDVQHDRVRSVPLQGQYAGQY